MLFLPMSSDKTSLLNCLHVLPNQYHVSLLIPIILGQVCCLKLLLPTTTAKFYDVVNKGT